MSAYPGDRHTQPATTRCLSGLRYLLLPWLLLSLHAVSAAEVLRVGIYQNPPKIFLSESRQASGFFPVILDEIAHREGWHIEYLPCQWEECLSLLEDGRLDLLPDVAWSPERAARFDFNNEIVLDNWSTLFRRRGMAIHSLADLEGRLVAVLRGSIQYNALRQQTDDARVSPRYVEVDHPAQLLELAASREVDAVLLNRLFGQQQRRQLGLESTHLIIEQSKLHFAAPREQQREVLQALDRQLQAMKQDPQSGYYRAMARWVEDAAPVTRIPGWLVLLLQGLLLVSLGLLIAILLQRTQLRRHRTELEQSHTAVRQSEQMFRSLFQHNADAIMLYNGKRFYDCNRAALSMFGYPDRDALAGVARNDLFPSHQPDGEPSASAADRLIAEAEQGGFRRVEWLHRRAGGEVFPSEVTLVPVRIGEETIIQATIRDLSRQQAQQQALDHMNRALRTLTEVNHTLVHAQDEKRLLDAICRIIVADGGYRMAWIGYAEYDDTRTIRPVAQAGFEPDYLASLTLDWHVDNPHPHPSALAIRHGNEVIITDILRQPHYAWLHDEARQYRYNSCISLPLQREQATFGALNIYSGNARDFTAEDVLLLRQLADDLTFGIVTLRRQADHGDLPQTHHAYQQHLQHALLQTIQSFVVMLEMRDPYTAGHQRRSADLAISIAREMGLDEQRVEGIRFGAMLHDIGNIQVPAEILIRPGSLTPAETRLMRNHVEAGYAILRDIDFPWPVAEMIHHHHERHDGSGYPRGLQGEQIPLESRIIGVADVVEAMLSHRPYRSAHDTLATLEELRSQRGKAFDEQVVDACLRLFEQQGYRLPV